MQWQQHQHQLPTSLPLSPNSSVSAPARPPGGAHGQSMNMGVPSSAYEYPNQMMGPNSHQQVAAMAPPAQYTPGTNTSANMSTNAMYSSDNQRNLRFSGPAGQPMSMQSPANVMGMSNPNQHVPLAIQQQLMLQKNMRVQMSLDLDQLNHEVPVQGANEVEFGDFESAQSGGVGVVKNDHDHTAADVDEGDDGFGDFVGVSNGNSVVNVNEPEPPQNSTLDSDSKPKKKLVEWYVERVVTTDEGEPAISDATASVNMKPSYEAFSGLFVDKPEIAVEDEKEKEKEKGDDDWAGFVSAAEPTPVPVSTHAHARSAHPLPNPFDPSWLDPSSLSGVTGLDSLITHLMKHDAFDHALQCAKHLAALTDIPILEKQCEVFIAEDKHRDAHAVQEKITALKREGPEISIEDRVKWWKLAETESHHGTLSFSKMMENIQKYGSMEASILARHQPVKNIKLHTLESVTSAKHSYMQAKRAYFFLCADLRLNSTEKEIHYKRLFSILDRCEAEVSKFKVTFVQSVVDGDPFLGKREFREQFRAIVEVLRVAFRIGLKARMLFMSQLVMKCDALWNTWCDIFNTAVGIHASRRKRPPPSLAAFFQDTYNWDSTASIIQHLEHEIDRFLSLSSSASPSINDMCCVCGCPISISIHEHDEDQVEVEVESENRPYNDGKVTFEWIEGRGMENGHATCVNLWLNMVI